MDLREASIDGLEARRTALLLSGHPRRDFGGRNGSRHQSTSPSGHERLSSLRCGTPKLVAHRPERRTVMQSSAQVLLHYRTLMLYDVGHF